MNPIFARQLFSSTVTNASAFTLALSSSSGNTDEAVSGTVTPTGGPLSGAANVTLACSTGTFVDAMLDFASSATSAQTFSFTPTSDATHSITMTNTLGLTNTGSPASYTSTTSSFATTATLSGSTTGATGSTTTWAVTLNGDVPVGGGTVSISASTATLSTSTLTFTFGGATSQNFIIQRATDGTTAVSITNSMGLSNAGTPRSYTSTTVTSSGELPTLTTVTPSTTGTHGFAFGQAFKEGAIAPSDKLAGLQLDPLTYWSDGSVKHGIVSGSASMTADTPYTVTMSIGSAATGTTISTSDLATALTAGVTVGAGAFGSAVFGSGDWASPAQVVCTGPKMSSWVYRKQIGSDAHLVAWLEVRMFSTGAVEVFPWVENGYLAVASPTNKSDTYTFSLGGTSRFSAAIDIKHHTRIPLISSTEGSALTFSHWLGTDPGIVPAHDTAYLMATKLLPNLAWGAPSSTALDDLEQAYTPNTTANDTSADGSTGGAGGVVSIPSAMYLTSDGDLRAWKGMMTHGLSSGSWSHHYRDEATNLPLAFSDFPLATLADTSTPTIPTPSGTQNAAGPSMSHAVSYAFVPFLTTGRWWFLEELHFWATYAYLKVAPTYRENDKGAFVTGQPRTRAWSLNVLSQAATITPSSHPLQTEFVTSWQWNTAKFKSYYVDGDTYYGGVWVSPQGFLGDYTGNGDLTAPYVPEFTRTGDGTTTSFETYGTRDITTYTVTVNGVSKVYPTDWTVSGTSIVFAVAPASSAAILVRTNADQWWLAPWMHHYVSLVLGTSYDLGIPQSSQSLSDHAAVRDHSYKQQIQAAGDGLDGRFNWRHFTRYSYPAGVDRTGLPLETYWTAAQSYAAYIAEMGLGPLSEVYGSSLKYGSADITSSDSGRAYLAPGVAALALAVEQGVTGANEAWDRIINASNFVTALTSYLTDESPNWAVKPRAPTWVPAVGTVVDLTTNTINSAAGYTSNMWTAWSGVAWAPWWGAYGSIIASGGGHTDGTHNDVYRIDIGARLVTQIKPFATAFAKADGYIADTATGWMWANATGGDTTVQTGEPFTAHFYGGLVALPPDFSPSGATNGSLYTGSRTGMPNPGSAGTLMAHSMRLGVDTTWVARGVGAGGGGYAGYDFKVFDPARNRVWYKPDRFGNEFRYRDLSTDAETLVSFAGVMVDSFSAVASYMSADDCIFSVFPGGSGHVLSVIDLAAQVSYRPTTTGTPPPSWAAEFAWGWSDTWHSAFYFGSGNTIWFLKPTGDPRTAPWAWSSQSITGTVRSAGANGGFNRLRHAPTLGNVLIWCPDAANPVQAICVTTP